MNGYGVFTWTDGRSYSGDYVNSKKEGNGVFRWSKGQKYDGQWLNGKQHGFGKYYKKDDSIGEEGEWFEGKRKKT